MPRQPLRITGCQCSGFTLIEVVLAILIALSILLVMMFFYSQAAELRNQLLRETDRLSAIRLVMERLTSDLRCARSDFAQGIGLKGDATSVSFLSTAVLSSAAWNTDEAGRVARAESDLRRISYRATTRLEETNVLITGLTRDEQPMVKPRATQDIFADALDPLFWEDAAPAPEEPLTEAIRFVRFRYWDGSAWQAVWDSEDLPRGVEVSFGGELLPEDLTPDEYPFEVFRRIVYLPMGVTP